jgi:hypothetical protein
MSGGGSEVTTGTPWSQAQPYLLDIMNQSQGLYNSSAPQYANPASNFGYGQTTGAVGSAINGTNPIGSLSTALSPGVSSAISSQLSGVPDYTAVNNALNAANTQTWNSFNNTELPQLNQRASFLGNPSGAIKDLNWATSQIGNNMNLNAQQAYLGQYNDALARQANAASLGANIAQTAGAQSLQGASLYPTIAQMPQQNLADYANTVSQTGGKFGSSSTSTNPGAAGTAANIIGGLTAGSGLLSQLLGGPSSTAAGTPGGGGLVGQIGSLLGAGSTAGIGAGATTAANAAAGDIGASVAPTVASDSAGIAAGNDAWLGSQAAAQGLGGAAGGAVLGGDAAAAAAGGTSAGLVPVGSGLIDAGADTAAASAANALGGSGAAGAAAGGGGGGAAAGSLAGGAIGLGILAAPLIAGLMTQGVKVDQQWYTNIQNNLNSSNPATRIQAVGQAIANPDVMQHIAQDNPTLYQQIISGQFQQQANAAYAATQRGGSGSVKNRNGAALA